MEKYKIQKTIGSGSFANVSKAINIQTNETVAIKKMKKKFSSWDECLSLREIKALTKLSHPNIMKLKEVIRVNEDLYCVFEYCDQNLYQYYLTHKENGSKIPEIQLKQIFYQIVEGLAYMHKHGFFHRDLKPENILYTKGVIKIADLGLAREIRSRPPYTDYVATRWYRAPEILLKSLNYNSPVDIYALGCILAELLQLTPLFPGSSEFDQIHKICGLLGTPSMSTWAEGYRLATQIGFSFPQYQGIPLGNVLFNTSSEGVHLVSIMLSFDPFKRPTALQILAHPFLNGVKGGVPGVITSRKQEGKVIDNMSSDEEELVLTKNKEGEIDKGFLRNKGDLQVWKGRNSIDFIKEEKKKPLPLQNPMIPFINPKTLVQKPFLIKGNPDKADFKRYDEELDSEIPLIEGSSEEEGELKLEITEKTNKKELLKGKLENIYPNNRLEKKLINEINAKYKDSNAFLPKLKEENPYKKGTFNKEKGISKLKFPNLVTKGSFNIGNTNFSPTLKGNYPNKL